MRNKTLILFSIFFTGFKCSGLDAPTVPLLDSAGINTDTIQDTSALLRGIAQDSPDIAVLEAYPMSIKSSEAEEPTTVTVEAISQGAPRYLHTHEIPGDDDSIISSRIKTSYEKMFNISEFEFNILNTKIIDEGNIGEVYKSLSVLSTPSSAAWVSFQSIFDAEQILGMALDWNPSKPMPLISRIDQDSREARGISFNNNGLPSVQELSIAASYLISKYCNHMCPFMVVAKYFKDENEEEIYHYPIYILRDKESYLLTISGAEKLDNSTINFENILRPHQKGDIPPLTSEDLILLLRVNECGQIFNLWGERIQALGLLGDFSSDPAKFKEDLAGALRVRGVQLLANLISVCASDLKSYENGELIKEKSGGILQRLPVLSHLEYFGTSPERVFIDSGTGYIAKNIPTTMLSTKISLPDLIEDLSKALKNIWNSLQDTRKKPIHFSDLAKKLEEQTPSFDPNTQKDYFDKIAQSAVNNFDILFPELFSNDGKRFVSRS